MSMRWLPSPPSPTSTRALQGFPLLLSCPLLTLDSLKQQHNKIGNKRPSSGPQQDCPGGITRAVLLGLWQEAEKGKGAIHCRGGRGPHPKSKNFRLASRQPSTVALGKQALERASAGLTGSPPACRCPPLHFLRQARFVFSLLQIP